MFWEHTPATSMDVQTGRLPTTVHQCAYQQSLCIQRVVRAIPKIIAFVLVAGTHYQFLWYIARVFLPGKKELCELSALVTPKQYADILTQKELRKYALILLKGNKG